MGIRADLITSGVKNRTQLYCQAGLNISYLGSPGPGNLTLFQLAPTDGNDDVEIYHFYSADTLSIIANKFSFV